MAASLCRRAHTLCARRWRNVTIVSASPGALVQAAPHLAECRALSLSLGPLALGDDRQG
eukprot:CAMPEP_0206166346 /NCGR_PEP_ID=MMETSP1474-20131121/23810_1 /ASSEMBLY_ACC=CAM_ASM_001110 /TAXON_ID=97495 /ORGANISM="Imantonia sp., Strain RCC918" /LENGTH=58 /DNA_ID=CAMNT_0053570309 /DNA_START=9 /DNA_END=182 /DNA_ORIENTATION=+